MAEGFEELLIGCRGGCSLDEVLAAVGLSGNELGLEPVARADGNLHGGPGSSDGAELPATPVEVIP
ncbi:MAG TPA: hypothetical protein VMH24_06775 [Candidatus Sulfotelmatobacter sp.]|nr:hypothetical protein [Candidatus Sulfotelmatobacter sp.]